MSAILNHLIHERGADESKVLKTLEDWELVPIMSGDVQVGEMMLKGNEVHFALNEDSRLKLGARKQVMQTIFNDLFETRDFLITKMFRGDRYIPLVEFFGFEKIKSDDKFDYYWMNKEDCRCLH